MSTLTVRGSVIGYAVEGPDDGTPLLLFHGTEDPFFPASIAVDFHNQIAAHSTPVELLLFQGEGHGLGDPSNHVTAAQWQIRWFRTYLSDSARTWTIALPVVHG